MLGLVFIILWPIMGLAAFLTALLWFSFRHQDNFNIKRFLKIWTGLALGLSALCVVVDMTEIFIIPGSKWPDFIFYGPLMIWPLPFGTLLGRGLVWIARKALKR